MKYFVYGALLIWLLALSEAQVKGFALLGPTPPWLQTTNNRTFRIPSDIGGPMNIDSGYRWNVPVVTYGFDQSFVDFFGSDGVAAVEAAIQVLNNVPPASNLVLTNYAFTAGGFNHTAEGQQLHDLKTKTLALLLEQLGLTQPDRYVFVLTNWTPVSELFASQAPSTDIGFGPWVSVEGLLGWAEPGYISQLNFDPVALQPSQTINGTTFYAILANDEFDAAWENQSPHVMVYSRAPDSTFPYSDLLSAVVNFDGYLLNYFGDDGLFGVVDYTDYSKIVPMPISITEDSYKMGLGGLFFNGLSYDDAGGLMFLLSTNNVKFENLFPGVFGVGTNLNAYVDGALRPGVDKITFVPQAVDPISGAFHPMTNYFTDTYISNGIFRQQQLARLVSQPDFLFTAGSDWSRTGTTNWLNNAALNGNPSGTGPGQIRPQVVIAFPKMGRTFFNAFTNNAAGFTEDAVIENSWFLASFDGSTNAPIVYPENPSGNLTMTVRIQILPKLGSLAGLQSVGWNPSSAAGTVYSLQTSTNFNDWNTLFTVTNNGSVCTYINDSPNAASRFYRLTTQ